MWKLKLFSSRVVFLKNIFSDESIYAVDENGNIKVFNICNDFIIENYKLNTKCLSICHSEESFFILNDLNQIMSYDIQTFFMKNTLSNFKEQIKNFSVSADKKFIALFFNSSRMTLVLLKENNMIIETEILKSIKDSKFNPANSEYLLLLDNFGCVSIFSTSKMFIIKKIELIEQSEKTILWLNSGNLFCVSSKEKIYFYENITWLFKYVLGIEESFIENIYIPKNDFFIVLISKLNDLLVFDFINFKLIYKHKFNENNRIRSCLVCDKHCIVGLNDGDLNIINFLKDENEQFSNEFLVKIFDNDNNEKQYEQENISNKRLYSLKKFEFKKTNKFILKKPKNFD